MWTETSVENEEGPRIFLSRVLLEAPLSPLKEEEGRVGGDKESGLKTPNVMF